MTEQELWLDDHPDKTAADFEHVSTEANAIEFLIWQEVCRLIDDGYVARLGGGKFRKIKQMTPEYKRQRKREEA